jgi:hypothetical protein
MVDLEKDCEMVVLSEKEVISDFDCGNADLIRNLLCLLEQV